jgi:NAD(P)H-quinone oxidoreductase subunit K
VDVYLPDSSPRPEAIIDAIIKLRKKVANESMQEQCTFKQTHRYYTITHKMKPGSQIITSIPLASSHFKN